MTEKYIMMSMDDAKMKHLADVLGNPSCKRILDLLAEKDLSESDIASSLKMPLNTIDYNVKKLVQAGLIEQASHWWSIKGKKIPVYRISNKKIIISPRTSKLKSIVPSVFFVGAASVFLRYYLVAKENMQLSGDNFVQKASESAVLAAAPSSESIVSIVTSSGNWLWFLAGGLVALIIFILLNWRRL